MMLSPESFMEDCIKGKSYEEAVAVLNDMRSESERLEKLLKEDPFSDEVMVRPSPDTVISFYKIYFRYVKKYFEEKGWDYSFPETVIADERFNKRLDDLTSVSLAIGPCFRGQELNLVIFDGEKLISNIPDSRTGSGDDPAGNDDHSPDRKRVDREEFITKLKDLHIGEWDEEYHDLQVMDGTEWEAEFKFSDGSKKLFMGSNKYPMNFEDFMELMGVEY